MLSFPTTFKPTWPCYKFKLPHTLEKLININKNYPTNKNIVNISLNSIKSYDYKNRFS